MNTKILFVMMGLECGSGMHAYLFSKQIINKNLSSLSIGVSSSADEINIRGFKSLQGPKKLNKNG